MEAKKKAKTKAINYKQATKQETKQVRKKEIKQASKKFKKVYEYLNLHEKCGTPARRGKFTRVILTICVSEQIILQ